MALSPLAFFLNQFLVIKPGEILVNGQKTKMFVFEKLNRYHKNKDFNPNNCPITYCLNIIGGRWMSLIIFYYAKDQIVLAFCKWQ